jgi:predicted dehydrogenase
MSAGGRPRAAIAGAGLMGYWHAAALARLGIRVAAVIDPQADRARMLLRLHPSARVHGDLQEFLARQDAEILHLCTPAGVHAEQTRQALVAGIHVLVEKPVGANAAQTAELLELAAQSGRQLCPVHQFPFQAGVLRLSRVLDQLGPIRHVDFQACSAGGEFRNAAERDVIAADILPHPLSLLVRLLPRPVVDSMTWMSAALAGGEIRALGCGQTTTVDILVSMAGRPTRNIMTVTCERGSAHLDLFHGFMTIERGNVSRLTKAARPFALAVRTFASATANLGARAWRREPAYPGLRELIRRYHAAIERGTALPIPAVETLMVAEIRDRIVSAALNTSIRNP